MKQFTIHCVYFVLFLDITFTCCDICPKDANINGECLGPFIIEQTSHTCSVEDSTLVSECIRECMMMFCCRAGSVQQQAGVCVFSHHEDHNMNFVKKVPQGTRTCVEGMFYFC